MKFLTVGCALSTTRCRQWACLEWMAQLSKSNPHFPSCGMILSYPMFHCSAVKNRNLLKSTTPFTKKQEHVWKFGELICLLEERNLS